MAKIADKYFEEGYSGAKLIGSYFNGIYERTKPDYGHYKGIADFTEYMVNSVNWLYTRIEADSEVLDLAKAETESFVRVLGLRTGELKRSFLWNTKSGKKIEITFERLLSMTKVDTAAQKITLKAVDFDGTVKVISGLDFSEVHKSFGRNMWSCEEKAAKLTENAAHLGILGRTVHTK